MNNKIRVLALFRFFNTFSAYVFYTVFVYFFFFFLTFVLIVPIAGGAAAADSNRPTVLLLHRIVWCARIPRFRFDSVSITSRARVRFHRVSIV